MRRRWSGIGAEVVPLVLILVCLAGSLGLVVTVHRRFVERSTSNSVVAVAFVSPPTWGTDTYCPFVTHQVTRPRIRMTARVAAM